MFEAKSLVDDATAMQQFLGMVETIMKAIDKIDTMTLNEFSQNPLVGDTLRAVDMLIVRLITSENFASIDMATRKEVAVTLRKEYNRTYRFYKEWK